MMGSNKSQDAKYIVGSRLMVSTNVYMQLNTNKEVLTLGEDSHKGSATIYFKGCRDCEYVVDSLCTKIMIGTSSLSPLSLSRISLQLPHLCHPALFAIL